MWVSWHPNPYAGPELPGLPWSSNVMRRFLSFVFALAVVLGTVGAESRLPAELPHMCDCGCGAVIDPGADSTCPCGMPQNSPQPCAGATSQALQAPARPITAPAESAENSRPAEPSPLPARLASLPAGDDTTSTPLLTNRSGTDPPRPSQDRQAQLATFRI